MNKITITSEGDLKTAAKNSYHILRKYAESVDHYHTVHGSVAKDNMNYWRRIALDFLKYPTKEIKFKENPEINFEP